MPCPAQGRVPRLDRHTAPPHASRLLDGPFNLLYAETHAIVLPHAMAYNSTAVPDVEEQIAQILGASAAPTGLYDFADRLGIAIGLPEIGMPEAGIGRAANLAIANSYWSPRPAST